MELSGAAKAGGGTAGGSGSSALVCSVQPVPSHQRAEVGEAGSGYQPAGTSMRSSYVESSLTPSMPGTRRQARGSVSIHGRRTASNAAGSSSCGKWPTPSRSTRV